MRCTEDLSVFALLFVGLAGTVSSQAATLAFSDADFTLNPVFSDVRNFSFEIDISQPLASGTPYSNPVLHGVDYAVSGSLSSGTPSGFSAFNLERTIGGAEFYNQGSSLSFEIVAGADLSDGLQVSELAGSGTVFTFDGREVNTGRYHPALLELNADGTGRILNSNNSGGVNRFTGEEVNVYFGDEYVTELTFDPKALTIATVVPLPAAVWLFASALGVLGYTGWRGQRRSTNQTHL